MKLHIKLHREIDADFARMAKEAGISCADMAEICVYSVLAGWLQARAEVSVPVPAVADARKPAAPAL